MNMARLKSPKFNLKAAHKYFSAHCFNRAWDLIEKEGRLPEEDRLMVALNQASLYHWSQRPDCTDRNRSIGYWQASRIQAILGNAVEARRYAEICLSFSHELEPFYLGYAYEALARAAGVAGNRAECAEYLAAAVASAKSVSSKEDRELLESDLAGLE
jgi:hypothetical protein